MMLKQRLTYLAPANLTGLTAGGSTVKVALDRTWPLEEILIIADIVTAGTTGTVTADGLAAFLSKAMLEINDGRNPRTVVNFSGPGLLEYAQQVGAGMDPATLGISGTLATGKTYRLCYRIPLVHPMITEPLRTRMLLDVNNHPQDPILTLQFGAITDMSATGTMTTANVEVVLVKREMPKALNDAILSAGGYIPFDLVESSFTLPTGSTAEQRLPVPTPGQYAGLLVRTYKGGSALTRDEITGNARFRLESGGVTLREWKPKHLYILNSLSRPLNAYNSINFGQPAAASNTYYSEPGSTFLDFLSDGIDSANELGSLLDCNLPVSQGLKMELVLSSITSVSTSGSVVYFGGHRYFGDLSRYQTLK